MAHYVELADNCEGQLSEAYLTSDTELFREVLDLCRVHHIWVFDAGLNYHCTNCYMLNSLLLRAERGARCAPLPHANDPGKTALNFDLRPAGAHARRRCGAHL